MERIILKKISPVIEPHIPIHQGGFRSNRSCCDQVLALTSHIEKGYNDKNKSGAAFIDLSAVYDTVWKDGLLWKLSNIIKCPRLVQYFKTTLGNRNFRVHLGNQISRTRILNNGLPQGSVIAPILFNIYTHDILCTDSNMFSYADDICIVTQDKKFENIEGTLTSDLLKAWLHNTSC
jgi:retron-type reverse transcriptase